MELFQIWDHQRHIFQTSHLYQLEVQQQVIQQLMHGKMAKIQLLQMVN